MNDTPVYPKDLLSWAGHREGGVKKPFLTGSGRPAGILVETPVVLRLRAWMKRLHEGKSGTPTNVILVGGPGNGKTELVEVAISHLDALLGAENKLFNAFAAAFAPAPGRLAPRLVTVTLADVGISPPEAFPKKITLVQDATERDAEQPKTPAPRLLLEELRGMLEDAESDTVYLCCANRGVISEAAAASAGDPDTRLHQLMSDLLEAVTSGPKNTSCWPLKRHPALAVWPMDIESIAEPSGEKPSGAHQIVAAATNSVHWPAACPAGKGCPFCTNRRLLAEPPALDAFVRLLRFYELGSGKRWSFRDLFSTVAYSIVGLEDEYSHKGNDPCAWAEKMVAATRGNTADSHRARLELVSRLYPHRLFSLWPSLRAGALAKAYQELSKLKKPELEVLRALIGWIGSRQRRSFTDATETLRGPWSKLLDPALAPSDAILVRKKREQLLVGDIEERFSLSIRDGLDAVADDLTHHERELLTRLAAADDALWAEDMPRLFVSHARNLQAAIRQFSCRLVKRSLGVRLGVCRNLHDLSAYHRAVTSEEGLKDFRKQLTTLLHDEKNRFHASLSTTFGQPVPYRTRNVVAIAPKIQIRAVDQSKVSNRPVESTPYVRIKDHIVPVTFPLFSSFRDVDRKLHPASLPREIYALLDATRSIVTGQVIRDRELMEDGGEILIGGCDERILLDGATPRVVSASEE